MDAGIYPFGVSAITGGLAIAGWVGKVRDRRRKSREDAAAKAAAVPDHDVARLRELLADADARANNYYQQLLAHDQDAAKLRTLHLDTLDQLDQSAERERKVKEQLQSTREELEKAKLECQRLQS